MRSNILYRDELRDETGSRREKEVLSCFLVQKCDGKMQCDLGMKKRIEEVEYIMIE